MNLSLILTLFNKREKRHLIFVFLAILIMGFVELVGVGSLGPFISIVTNTEIIHSNRILNAVYSYFNFPNDNSFIIATGIIVIIALAVSNLLLSVLNYIIYYYSAKRRYSLSMRMFEKYLRQPYIFYLNINTSTLSRSILDDINTFINNVLIHFLNLISCSIISLSIVVLLCIFNPLLALVIILLLGILYIAIFSIVRKFLTRKGDERSRYNSIRYKTISEAFGGIKDIKILTKEKVFLNFFDYPSKSFAINDAYCNVVGDLPKYIIETIAIGGIVAVIIFLIRAGYKISDFLPVLTVYAFGAYRLLPLLQKIFRAASSIRYSYYIVENLSRDYKELPRGVPLTEENIPPLAYHNEIKLEDIIFRYPLSNKEIIKKQNLTVKANTSIALVGTTGCGKTTLVDIILGLLEPQEGRIYIDGVIVDDSNRKNWQKNLGYVPQSIYLTDDTIRNNIAFGLAPKDIDDEAIINAARLANIHDFITNELEKKYDSVIGERGIRLSGGQRQRIGIARAVYHNPKVLILDEATSALDSLTENAIMDAIKNLNHKKTIIIIAHRITTVKNCDLIYLMEKGRIIDSGNYAELYSKNASFKKMADGS
jgi:ABC-type multidrug transport system fused ATPase/permease subunit